MCYLPITLFVLAVLVLLFYSIKEGVRCRKIAIPACAAAILLLPWTMALVEGAASYRAAQYIPLLCGFSALLVARDVKRIQDRGREALSAEVGQRGDRLRCLAGPIAGLLAVICIYNQCAEMNKWFYVDALKYEDARKVMNGIAYELGKNCDVSKPVIFAGLYEAPDSIVQDARLPLDSEKFALVAKLADLLDVHLKEKYYHNGYYQFAEVPLYSVLSWGVISFEGTNQEMFRFWEMHGHSFLMETDAEKHREANAYAEEQDMPAWPREGSILEREEYIIVRLGD